MILLENIEFKIKIDNPNKFLIFWGGSVILKLMHLG